MPPLPENLDEDDVVEDYLDKVADVKERIAERAETERNRGKSEEQLLEEVQNSVAQVIRNIETGDSPFLLSHVYLLAYNPGFEKQSLGKKGALEIIVRRDAGANDNPFEESAESKLFTALCGDDEDDTRMSESLAKLKDLFKNPEAAVPALVDEAVQDGLLLSSDALRLKDLFGVWMQGVTWEDCRTSAINRPSLGSWRGMPWDSDNVMTRALTRGIFGRLNIDITVLDFVLPTDRAPPSMAHLFHLIWSKRDTGGRGGPCADLPSVVYSTITAGQSFAEKHGPAALRTETVAQQASGPARRASQTSQDRDDPCDVDFPPRKKRASEGVSSRPTAKVCPRCVRLCPRKEYSDRQWKNAEGKAICTGCIGRRGTWEVL